MSALLHARLPVSIVYRSGSKSKVCAAVSTHIGPRCVLLSLYDTPKKDAFLDLTFVLRITLPDLLDTLELSARLGQPRTLPRQLHTLLLHGHKTQARWDQFLTTLTHRPQDPALPAHRSLPLGALTLQFESLEAFLDFAQIDVHLGGIFLPTDRILPINSLLVLKLIHPLSPKHCTVDTRVVRHIGGAQPGLSLRFCHDPHLIAHKLKALSDPTAHSPKATFAHARALGTWPFTPQALHPQGLLP